MLIPFEISRDLAPVAFAPKQPRMKRRCLPPRSSGTLQICKLYCEKGREAHVPPDCTALTHRHTSTYWRITGGQRHTSQPLAGDYTVFARDRRRFIRINRTRPAIRVRAKILWSKGPAIASSRALRLPNGRRFADDITSHRHS